MNFFPLGFNTSKQNPGEMCWFHSFLGGIVWIGWVISFPNSLVYFPCPQNVLWIFFYLFVGFVGPVKANPRQATTALPAADTPIACNRKTLSCCRRCWGDVLPLLGECCWRRVSRAALQSSCSCGMLARLVEAVPCAERGKWAKREVRFYS